MIIQHNLLAMNTSRNINIITGKSSKVTEELSSGYKINRAADDAAGLSISEKMRRQIRGLTQGIENTQDGVSLCQVADGALAEVSDMIHRLTELSIKSANGTNSEQDRGMIQEEVQQILQEIDRIGNTTTFNERRLFTSKTSDAEANAVSAMTRGQAIRELSSGSFSVGTTDIEIDGKTITKDTINSLASAYSTEYLWYHYESISTDPTQTAEVTRTFTQMAENIKNYMMSESWGADGNQRYTQTQVDKMSELITNHIANLVANNYTDINDASNKFQIERTAAGFDNPTPPLPTQIYNFSQIASNYYLNNATANSHASISNQAGMAASTATRLLTDQFGADFVNSKLWDISYPYQDTIEDPIKRYIELAGLKEEKLVEEPSEALHIWIQSGCDSGAGMCLIVDPMDTYELGIRGLNVSTEQGALEALDIIDEALEKVSANRSKIGAQQNRLEHTIANEENIVENTTYAESRIRDTDMAEAMVEHANNNIIIQAGQAMLAQANHQPDGILQLLQ